MKAHNTHYATKDLDIIKSYVDHQLESHPFGCSSLSMNKDEVRGFRLALVGVLAVIDALRSSL